MSFTKVEYRGLEVGKIGIGSTGGIVAVGATMLNFIGAGNTFAVSADGTTIDISIAGGGGGGPASEVLKETFNVSGTQSVFNITEGQFDEGFLEVYLNGVKLNQSDFTEKSSYTIHS